MKYKLIASDFDGTIARNDSTVSEETIKAINEYRAAGGIFTLATGRSPDALTRYKTALGFDSISVPMVCSMGATIFDTKTEELLGVSDIKPDVTIALIEWFNANGIYFHVNTVNGGFVLKHTEFTEKYENAVGIKLTERADLFDYIKSGAERVIKVLGFVDERNFDGMRSKLVAKFDSIKFIRSTAPLLSKLYEGDYRPTMAECISAECDKGVAVGKVANMLGFDISEVAVFGDSYNDSAMLKAAGMGVAMGNAPDDVKAIARAVTDTNENDGLAKAIRKIIAGEDL